MHRPSPRSSWIVAATIAVFLPVAGCVEIGELDDLLEDIEIKIFNSLESDRLQDRDPRTIVVPDALADRGDTIIINNNVVVVNNIREDIIVEEVPDATLLAFENLRGLDAYFAYLANGEFQGVFVFAGETLLLDYPCLDDVELLSEEYFDPFDGVLLESNDLFDALFLNPDDFFCGEALIFSFDDDGVFSFVEPIDLLD